MVKISSQTATQAKITQILADYAIAVESRECSLIGRKEVFMGKAKFGIFGDGKEMAQIAMARTFRHGDWRSGYYRDQTLMMALGELTSQQFFAQLYAHTDLVHEPASAGRMMNGHFGTRSLNERGEWNTLTDRYNSASDISPTAAQMPRLLGLAWASKLYRQNPALSDFKDFSINGNEVAFGTIGNGATSEGHFLETLNAAGVLQVPMVIGIWDDGYGISVPQKYHTIKESISKALAGYQRTADEDGFEILTVRGWDYPALIKTFKKAANTARNEHVPVLVHVEEMTQPQGHSTSGSHERYKPKSRLDWEKAHDCIEKTREWILTEEIADEIQLEKIEKTAKADAKRGKELAWKTYILEIKKDQKTALSLMTSLMDKGIKTHELRKIHLELKDNLSPLKSDVTRAVRTALWQLAENKSDEKQNLLDWYKEKTVLYADQYNSHIFSQSKDAAILTKEVRPEYSEGSKLVDGREVLQTCFDHHLSTNPLVVAFGEDVGKIGDVNQGFAGLQDKHGELRVMDTGIRETSIIGQGIGAALRGLRPIAEIQYVDYVLYCIQTLSDDLATLQYRMKGGQKAPLIIRTRGHRLEGVWHSGSPMGMLINALRGIYIIVPRNMTQAAGFYNTLLESDDTALMIESLNGYRLKERIPDNLSDIRTPLGVPEVLRTGQDLTIVTYGSMCRIVMQAAAELDRFGISVEVIDIQTLLPFDVSGVIIGSLKKTNRILFVDEDVPGGASAFMMQQVLERDNGYEYLDSAPATLTGKEHRPAYGSDGDYFSKPNMEDVFERAHKLMSEADPIRFSDPLN